MSYALWESNVELYESGREGLVPVPTHPIIEMTLDPEQLAQDSLIMYTASSRRQVSMRVLGLATNGPVVQPRADSPARAIEYPVGVLVGCRHPEESILLPGVLRTFYQPVIEVDGHSLTLPTPIKGLRKRR